MRRYLILHPGALGDVLISISTIGAIKNKGNPSIHLAAKAEIGYFLNQIGFVDSFSDIESAFYFSLYTEYPKSELSSFIQSFHKVYLFTANNHSQAAINIKHLAPESTIVKTIPDIKTEGSVNAATFRLRQIDIGMPNNSPLPLEIPKEGIHNALSTLKKAGYSPPMPIATIHPGSGSPKKNIPLNSFLRIADYLIKPCGFFVLFLTGYAEEESVLNNIIEYVNKENRAAHFHCLSLLEIASGLKLSSLYLGNDSGISHLASKVIDNIIVFFKSTKPDVWAPQGDKIKIIGSDYETKAMEHINLLFNAQKTETAGF